jgi:hypothetical protein
MTEYPGDLLPFPSAYLLSSLPHLHERVIRDPSKPSGVRVLGRSLFMIAAGWLLASGWLWLTAVQQPGMSSHAFGLATIAAATVPAAIMALIGYLFGRYVGRASYPELNWREWRHAFGWSIVPNALLLSTAWLILTTA